jgi:hypothetical protein
MSDFRVLIETNPVLQNDSTRKELDWDEKKKRWFLSEKEQYEVNWLQNLIPEPDDLEELYIFFQIDKDQVEIKNIAFLSPGVLALIHQNNHVNPTIYAFLCDKCGRHWYIYRWESANREWRVYGRDCEFSWKRGEPLDSVDLDRLNQMKGPKQPL